MLRASFFHCPVRIKRLNSWYDQSKLFRCQTCLCVRVCIGAKWDNIHIYGKIVRVPLCLTWEQIRTTQVCKLCGSTRAVNSWSPLLFYSMHPATIYICIYIRIHALLLHAYVYISSLKSYFFTWTHTICLLSNFELIWKETLSYFLSYSYYFKKEKSVISQ